ncbi:hypothetical protein AB1Y20_018777 [Prymnesium parvum]|uniref:ATP-dependent transporter ycf16 n=1 Tax=Prymnesium parvum TaxID=97485 RepID=A0AB34JR38_PRYPA
MLASRQFAALLAQHAARKWRAPRTTCAEVLGPALLLSSLVLGYASSHDDHFAAMSYAALSLNLQPLVHVLASAGLDLDGWGGPAPPPPLASDAAAVASGRLEVFHEGKWAAVCDDRWGILDATVACAQLGLAVWAAEYEYDARADAFLMDDVECTGLEGALAECAFGGWGRHDCAADEAVGLLCYAAPHQLAEATRLDATPAAEGALRLAELVVQSAASCGGGEAKRQLSANSSRPSPSPSRCKRAPSSAGASVSSATLWDARTALSPVLDGPLPVLSMESFLAIGQMARQRLSPHAYAALTHYNSYARAFGNVFTDGTLHLAPRTAEVSRFLAFSRRRHPRMANLTVRLHASEEEAVRYVLASQAHERCWAVLSFAALSPTAVNYSLRLNYSTVPNTYFVTNFIARGMDAHFQRYHFSGFLTLQALVDEYAFELAAAAGARAVRPASSAMVTTPFPTAKYEQNVFFSAVGFMLGLVMTMCQLFPVSQLAKALVEEKDLRLKQTMRIMGMLDSVHLLAWLAAALFQFLVIAVLCTAVVSIFLVHSSTTLVFAYLLLFCFGCTSFALLLSVFFSHAKLAAVAGPVCIFAAVLPRYIFFGSNRFEQPSQKMLASLLLPTAFAFGADILADYEYSQVGLSTSNWGGDGFSFLTCLGMMAFDTLLYAVLYVYLDRVLPTQYGAHEPPLFFLSARYWACAPPPPSTRRATLPASDAFEPVADPSLPAIEIVSLRKTYGWGSAKKVAVDDLSLSMYHGQLTCLLGHNGAGKTTTLSVLTGLFRPTSGDVYVLGHSTSRSLRQVYKLLGICPQHDVLWPTITVAEHLALYATLKGVPPSSVSEKVAQMTEALGIADKAAAFPTTLSGGMKRKLSTGCALIGDSQAVLLDEPSSGMDPRSRRSMWTLLSAEKAKRVLVLTTHYMDEADALSDRIAIMSAGKLRCCGSPLFLKSRFGLGYTLTAVRKEGCSIEFVTETIHKFVPQARVLSAAGSELSFRLPFAAASSFPPMLRHLDAHSDTLHLGAYGVSISSMEEVFLQLAERQPAAASSVGARPQPVAPRSRAAAAQGVLEAASASDGQWGEPGVEEHRAPRHSAPLDSERLLHSRRGSVGVCRQLLVLLQKRWLCSKRDAKSFFTQQLLPVALVALVMLILGINIPIVGPRIRMDAGLFVPRSELVHNIPPASSNSSAVRSFVNATATSASPHDEHISLEYLERNSDLRYVELEDSLEASDFLLQTASQNSSAGGRYGALVVNDRLHLSFRQPGPFRSLLDEATLAAAVVCLYPASNLSQLHGINAIADGSDVSSGDLFNALREALLGLLAASQEDTHERSSGEAGSAHREEGSGTDEASSGEARGHGNSSRGPRASSSAGQVFGVSNAAVLNALSRGHDLIGEEICTSAFSSADSSSDRLTIDGESARERAIESALGLGSRLIVEYCRGFFPLSLASFGAAASPGVMALLPVGITHLVVPCSSLHPTMARMVLRLARPSKISSFGDGQIGGLQLAAILGLDGEQLLTMLRFQATTCYFGQRVRVSQLEGRLLSIDDLPDSLRGQLSDFRGMRVSCDELWLQQNEVEIRGLRVLDSLSGLRLHASAALLNDHSLSVHNFTVSTQDRIISRVDAFGWPQPPSTATINVSVPIPLNLLHNSSSWHALPAFMAEVTAAQWNEAHLLPNTTREEEVSYALYNHPLPLTAQQELRVKLALALLSALFVLIPFCYIPASAAVFIVRERAVKAKHLQLVSAGNPVVYWLASYFWDMLMYMVTCGGCLLVCFLFGEPAYVGNAAQVYALCTILTLYGLAVLPHVYCISFAFDSHSTAQIGMIVFNLCSGFMLTIIHIILSLLPETASVAAVLVHVYRLFPTFVFGEALLELTKMWYERQFGIGSRSPSDWDVTGFAVVYLPCQAVGYILVLMLFEHSHALQAWAQPLLNTLFGSSDVHARVSRRSRWCVLLVCCGSVALLSITRRIGFVWISLALLAMGAAYVIGLERQLRRAGATEEERAMRLFAAKEVNYAEEEDVAEERRRVSSFGATETLPTVVLNGLYKVYPAHGRARSKVAVADLSLAIQATECLGLLGANGCGKSTTMGMLTGDILPTKGSACVAGYDVVHQLARVRQHLGFCPQVDPLLDFMTGRETLTMFAKLKGIPVTSLHTVVEDMLEHVSLTPHADKVTAAYSGGNKRKLSLAVALIGAPDCILLDEPSSGMDPVSRRAMWDIVSSERTRSSIILTTHSMEECEALCTRVAVMTFGRLRCLGTPQHLKVKYGGGYILELRVTYDGREASDLNEQVGQMFPGCSLLEENEGRYKFCIMPGTVTLAILFEKMEQRKEALGVLEYSASQPPLESVFLSFVHSISDSSVTQSTVDSGAMDRTAQSPALLHRWFNLNLAHNQLACAESRVAPANAFELSSTHESDLRATQAFA